ncbi:MAG: GldM C-terminal domain [Bacteroidota bacterium]
MAEGHVDVKRYQIISLLYIVFICFSVINIKISVLDSNIYTIKSLQSIEKEELKKVVISNKIITDNLVQISKSPKAASYLKIRTRLSQSYGVINNVLKHVDDEFAKNNTTILKQFNSKNLIEEILKSDKGVVLLEKDLFELSNFIKTAPFKLQASLDEVIPLQKTITTIKGKQENWNYYLFYHKPTSISYMQLERIKLLITKTQLLYQEAALAEIGYQPTYFSQFNPKLYVLKSAVKEYKEEEIIKPGQKVVNITDEVFDDLFKKILYSLHTENIFVGLNNTLLNDFDFMMGRDFDIDITPKVNLVKSEKNYRVIFNKTGDYVLRFYDLRKDNKKVLFEKKIHVNPIPDPVVKVKGDNLGNYTISVKDLLSAERLEARLEINNLNYFPGRINSFKVVRIHNGKEEESVSNYGELFQSPTQKVLGALKKNDILIFDNVNMSLVDGSTRSAAPIIYKIID